MSVGPWKDWQGTADPWTSQGRVAAERALLVVDIDGTIRQGKDDALGRFVNGPEDVVVFPEAVEMMRRWKDAGGRIAGVSNQGGIGLGIVSEEQVDAAMRETDRQAEHLFDRLMWCSHRPGAGCGCRKPDPGMVVMAAHSLAVKYKEFYPLGQALFIGDRPEDSQCAKALDMRFQPADWWRAGVPVGQPPNWNH